LGFAHWVRDQPRYALLRAGVGGVDRVVACSPWVERELAANGIAAECLRLPVPPPGPAFRRAPADHPLFVYCGRLSVEKGVAILIRAFARLWAEEPSARLRIIGDGPERSALERLAAEHAPAHAVSFTGWQGPESVEGLLADASALVAPSLWAEPFGLAALEAIVRGVPVIASRTGGFADTVEQGVTGLLFPNGDTGALLECLRTIARRAVFPTRSLPYDVARRVAERHALAPHIERVRGILAEIADRRTIR
jgi:glycosyltransferase involved in cell wall biosynthesis